jgi:sterol desaturase/sphingolipid hydroxylase (fatty acid hydroxylase superfamily)
MKFEKIHNKGQAQLFQHPALEMLTKAHPLLIWGMYLPVVIGFPLYASNKFEFPLTQVAVLFFAGMIFWTLFEYVMHRWVFHAIAESERGRKFVYIMHGNHHHYPRDRERLFMPPVPSLIISSAIFGLMWMVLKENVFLFFPGFMLGYLLYGTTHYAIHAWNPPVKWMKPLWRNHHLHHYKDEGKGYGVSTTLWDRVFGTMFDLSKEKEDKQKVSELMFERKKPTRTESGLVE